MATKEQVKSFIAKFAPVAQQIESSYGVPASVTLGQAALESGWGTSGLAANYNNYFGIKATGDAGKVNLPSAEWDGTTYRMIDSYFGQYSSPEASFDAYGRLIGTSSIYKDAREKSIGWDSWADNIAAAGYATDPKYAEALKDVIRSNYLMNYDGTFTLPPDPDVDTSPGLSFMGSIVRVVVLIVLVVLLVVLLIGALPIGGAAKKLVTGGGAIGELSA